MLLRQFDIQQAIGGLADLGHCVRNGYIYRFLRVSHAKVNIKRYDPGNNIDWNTDAGGK
jgi:hypothetical protein